MWETLFDCIKCWVKDFVLKKIIFCSEIYVFYLYWNIISITPTILEIPANFLLILW